MKYQQHHAVLAKYYDIDRQLRQFETKLEEVNQAKESNLPLRQFYVKELVALHSAWLKVVKHIPASVRATIAAWKHFRTEMPPCATDEEIADQFDLLLWQEAHQVDEFEDFASEWEDGEIAVVVSFLVKPSEQARETGVWDVRGKVTQWLATVECKAPGLFELRESWIVEHSAYANIMLKLNRRAGQPSADVAKETEA